VAAIKSAIDNLQQASYALSKHMYDSAQQPSGGPAESAGKPSASGDDVIDAEFEKKS
jgi:molecular chaperone DnaK